MENTEWTRLSIESFPSQDKARRFINIMSNQYFGSEKNSLTHGSEMLDFRIIESNGKFYIEYKLLKKHAL